MDGDIINKFKMIVDIKSGKWYGKQKTDRVRRMENNQDVLGVRGSCILNKELRVGLTEKVTLSKGLKGMRDLAYQTCGEEALG